MAIDPAALNEHEDRHWRVLAHCLKRRRLAAGLSQQDLADRSGLSISEIQHIEHGRRHPKTGTQKRLCLAFGISHLELMSEVERVEREWAGRGQ